VVLCFSDPPGLVFTVAVLARLRGVPVVHWIMDAYPEIAAALGEVSAEGWLYRVVRKGVRYGLNECAVVGCLDEDMKVRLGLGLAGESGTGREVHLCLPWPPAALSVAAALPKGGDDGEAARAETTDGGSRTRLRWLYSGNLGRAHEYETLLEAQALLEAEGLEVELTFQGGGPMVPRARARAEELGLRGCVWQGYVEEEELVASLLEADVVVATQRPETCGLLWPSKLALLKHLPRPLVWVGPREGAIATLLEREQPLAVVFAPGEAGALAAWLRDEARGPVSRGAGGNFHPGTMAAALADEREAAVRAWHEQLKALLPGPM
jgi:hypothetical protein